MAKTKSNRKRGGSKQRGNWSSADHEHRTNTRIASLNKRQRRQQEEEEEEGEPPSNTDNNNSADAAPSITPKHPKTRNDEPHSHTNNIIHQERPLHQIRRTKRAHRNNHNRLASQVPEDAYKRSHLAHDNYDQIDSSKLRLATAQIQRKVDALKERLESWDPIDEAKLAEQDQYQYEDKSSIDYKMKLDAANRTLDRESRQSAQAEYNILYAKHGVNSSTNRRKANLKKKPRSGPESWKLRGAARPAWEVYDFDTRYVDVHLKARDEANEKARRSRNVMHLCRGRFAMDGEANDVIVIGDAGDEREMNGGNDNETATTTTTANNGNSKKQNQQQNQQQQSQLQFPPPQPLCRQYLSLLTQLGSLHLHRKNYSSARKSFLTAIDLEGAHHPHSITNARYQLMNMYLSTNRPTSARKLWNTLQADNSAWVKYSAALIEYVSWNLLQESGSTGETAERYLCEAIQGNVYVAYFLAWPETLERAMEYTEEVVERGSGCGKSGSVLEAIEYGCCHYLVAGEGGGNGSRGGGEKGEEEEDAMDRGMGMWLQTEGSLDWVRSVLLKVMNNGSANDNVNNNDKGGEPLLLTKTDLLSWDSKLNKEEEEHERERDEKKNEKQQQWEKQQRWSSQQESDEGVLDNDATSDDEDNEDEPDVVMYAGMFRTAMDWLQDGGEFLKEPSFDYIMEAQEEETEAIGDDNAIDAQDADVVLEGDNENERDDCSDDDTSKDGDDGNKEEEEESDSDDSDSNDE